MLKTALYLIPVPLGDTPVEQVLPSYNREVIAGIRHFIVENVRSARRFLKKSNPDICIDDLTFYELNRHTEATEVSGFLEPLRRGCSSVFRRFVYAHLPCVCAEPCSLWNLRIRPSVRYIRSFSLG